MPFLDRLEMVALSGWSRGAVYGSIRALEEAGLAASLSHASELVAPTRRYGLTAAGLRRLASEEDTGMHELLRTRPLSAHWRRLLLERLDAVAVVYRLAAGIADLHYPIRFRWYRAMPMDAAIALPDGRTLAVVRQGNTADRTAFAKRLWRLREGPRPGAYLLLAPDGVRLRQARRLMEGAPAPAFHALERDTVSAGPRARTWRTARSHAVKVALVPPDVFRTVAAATLLVVRTPDPGTGLAHFLWYYLSSGRGRAELALEADRYIPADAVGEGPRRCAGPGAPLR